MRTLILLAALVAALGTSVNAQDLESRPTTAGVAAVEAHWSQAFLHGDAAYLQALLTDDYISVNAKGVARNRAAIIALAQSFAARNGASPVPTQPPPSISVRGTTAISTSDAGGQRSVDVFYYAEGRWHAWYSQHTAIPN